MARLIPRKQIEEQQNITGSLEIGQDIIVGGNSIVAGNSVISGSLEVQNEFFLGNQLTDRGEITGSVFLTGSLEVDGELIFAGPSAVLSATASNALLAQDTLRYEGLRAKDFGANVPTLYVSSTDGNDANDGRTIQFPLRTIKRAAQLSQPGYDGRYGFDTGSVFNGYVIRVQAGTYLEDNPVILPSNTTIWGSGLRITKINAQNPEQDLFWVNSGCYIAEVTMGGLRLWPNEKEPQRGFGVAFQPGAFITTSPYVQNCSQISNQENSFTELYEEIPPGGGGLYVNGDAVDPDSPLASMVLDAYTQISPNGVGCLVNGRGFIQLVSFFTNFSYYAIRVNNGGHATLNNSNISFGLFGMYASGSRFISGSGGNTDARDKVRASYSVIVDVLNKGLEAGLPSVTTKNTAAGIRATSVTEYPQYLTSSGVVTNSDRVNEIVADFELVSQIVSSGTSDFPTLIAKSSTKGYGTNSPYNILGTPQITSSVSASTSDLNFISSSYGAILDIFNDGTASYKFISNTSASIKVTDTEVTPLSPAADYSSSLLVSSSFVTIYNIIEGGLSSVPKLVSNNSSSIKTGIVDQFTTGVSSSLSVKNSVSSSFSIVYNILANGTGSSILNIPQNHQRNFTVRKSNNSTKYTFGVTGSGEVDNASLTLFRGETYRFFVSAGLGPDAEPFFIRKQPISGFDYQNIYNYSDGVVNNGDSNGVITFQVPYNAPNKLYYISQDTPSFVGEVNIYNSSTTPKELIVNTLTYPTTLASSSVASTDVDKINGYELLINNIPFIQSEVIEFISSSWSDFPYNEASCSRDVGFIVNGVAYDLLYGGNEESIRSGLFYYQFPSEATTTQLGPTLTAVKYAAGMAQRLLENRTFVDADNDNLLIAESIRDNKPFVQNETIAYLSSSWSGFPYNEVKCKRDVGYILDAVATDLVYGGNERAIEAGVYYYQYPSLAIVANITTGQLNQTLDGIKYAAGTTINIITGSTFVTQSESRLAAAELLIDNKALIQDETIQYINVQYPTLDYNTSKCRRDVGYIIDAVATDLIYDGNESSTRAGRFYYLYPSVATSTQRRETKDGFLYSRVIGESIVQNIILETPRIITNDERLIKVTGLNNVTESLGGTNVESSAISSSFAIIEQIIKRGVGAINSAIAQNSGLNWSIDNPLSVTTGSQTTSSYVQPNELTTIKEGFERVNSIIEGGVASIPPLTASVEGLIKVTNQTQTTGSSISSDLTSSISSSFGYVVRVISGGTGSLEPIRLNTSASIKVTTTPQWISSNIGTNYETSSISSSFGTVINIINNGLSVRPTLISNTSASVKLTSILQYVSASYSGSLEDIQFISQSVSKVTQIIETGNVDLFGKTIYSTTASGKFGVYEIIKNNIEFIKEETIAYLSSSWSTFEYDSVKCRRDVGLIISGAAEDLLFNANSASIVNGQFYYEFPSEATGSQLAQTLDGINYASRLAQKLITNGVTFSLPATEISASNALLFNNKEFIQNETIAYLSSSWGGFDYNETTCKRDVGYIIDAVRTDLVYGGNERSRIAGEYYFLFPSAATGSQLLQTTDGILYASRLAQSIVSGSVFVSANSEKLEASRLLRVNKDLIAAEVVEYVSSSWSGVLYDDIKCKRDVGYIIDAVRTDLVYGGNERSTIAGDFYYRFPSAATVGGVPTVTAQLDPTVTGVEYANRLSQKVILSEVLSQPSQSITDAAELIRESRDFIQQNTIDFVYEKYPNFTYDVARCRRDTGFIVDAVVTDLVYGGNERTSTAGYFYYKYPSQATNTQVEETVAAINYAKELTKLIAVDKRALEETFDSVDKVILSGSVGVSSIQLVENTQRGIVVTGTTQTFNSASATNTDTLIVSSSFGNVINIINNGTGSIPTIVTNTQRGVNILGGVQITSSITPALTQQTKVGSGFNIVLDIIENGTGSLPTLVTNASGLIKRTNSVQYQTTASIANTLITSSNNSFDIVLDIVKEGTGSLPTLVKNAAGLLKVTNSTPYYSGIVISGSYVNNITSSFDTIINILENGTGSVVTLVPNTYLNTRVTSTPQYISASSATSTEATILSASISIVTNIVANGTGSAIVSASLSLPTSSYTTAVSDDNRWIAYGILKNNIPFIQDETIAYLSSSWSTASYDESKCRRDVGLIISGAAEDLVFNSNSASVVNGIFYYDYPSQAQGAQLNQTLDGIFYASELAQKLIRNIPFNLPSSQSNAAYDLVVLNKPFIQNEVIAYISSSWSTHIYSESVCRRDVGHILDAVATDIKWGGNQRSIKAGKFYYLYPSEATGSQIQETVTGIKYAGNLVNQILRGRQFTQIPHNRLEAKELIFNNKEFIQNEVIGYVSASWNGFEYVEETCKRDVGYILDAVTTDLVYGGNERSLEAGEFYYRYPSTATSTQLGPTLSGIRHAKNMVDEILQSNVFVTASVSQVQAYNLLLQNKPFIQSETIAYVSSSWSFFSYNEASCSRDTGYIVDAVATDILYGGNERVREAGEYYYLYPSLAIVNNNTTGQLDETLDGVKYAKGISQKIVANTLLQSPTTSERAGYELLLDNKTLIQNETIAFLSSSWSGVDGFSYNEAKCRRDVAYIVDAVSTDLLYGGNERSSKAGEFYFLYPSAATVSGYANPAAQLDQTTTGIKFASGLAQKLVKNTTLVAPSYEVQSSRQLLRSNVRFIQNETVEYVDAFYPSLVYLREKCRRDVGYILDAVITDLVYGGNERGIVAGDYYYRFPSLATGRTQVRETVDAVRYARELSKLIAQNVDLESPIFVKNIDGNIKASTATQFTSSVSATTQQVSKVNSSFEIVTDTIKAGVESFTPTNATYNPANGEFVITIPNHKLKVSNFIYLKAESFVFTCTMDGNRTEHALPSIGQPAYNNKLEIQSVTQNTITVNVGKSGPNVEFNPTSASYNPATGEFVVTVGEHDLSVGEGIVLSTGSFAFTCDMDNNHSTKSYPRFGIDPFSVRSIPITAVTNDTLTFNVGASAPNKYFTPSAANYNALTGDMILTVGQHGLGVGRSVTLASASIAFTCDQDNNQTTHSYPRSGSDPYAGKSIEISSVGFTQHTISNAPYNALSGIVTLTINNHGFSNGDYVKISDNSLTYTCILDGNVIQKSYPRPGYDLASGRWLEISNVTTNTFTINIGSSSYVDSHTFITASINGLERQTGTFTINVGDAGSASGSIHTFVSASANAVRHLPQSVHTFVSASAGAIKHYPQSGHTFVRTAKNSVSILPTIVSNVEGLIKVNDIQQITSSISGGDNEVGLISSSFKLIRDIIYNGSTSIPDALASNYDYGFGNETPTPLHITSVTQSLGDGSQNVTSLTGSVSSSYGSIKNIITNGTGSIPTLVGNTSASIKVSGTNEVSTGLSGSGTEINKVGNLFGIVLNIIENGTSVIPTLLPNNTGSIKVTNVPQFISGSAGRLQGRIVSASIGLVIDTLLNNGTSSIQYKAPSATPNTNTNVVRAYDLLINNKEFIQAETVQFMSSSWSTFVYNETSCSRDVGLIVSGAAFDLLYGGNSASFVNGRFYFDFPSEATSSQLDQTVTAIRYASGVAERIINGNIFTSITSSQLQPISASYELLRKNKGFIQSESIAYLSSSWSEFEYSQSTCVRDIGYIIDAVSTDLLYGGNERSIVAGDYYYRFPSTATTAQLEPTLTGIRHARGLGMEIVSGSTFQTPSAQVNYAYDIIKDNKLFIQSESIAFVNAKFPHFVYNEETCKRDLGYIIDAVITDLKWGGNERANKAGEFYYLYPSEATGVQVEETTAAVNYARLLTEQIMLNNLIAEPQPILNTIGLIKKSSTNQYISSSINSESGSSYEASLISASISIVTNIIRNGTGSIATPVDYTTPSTASNVYYAYNLVKQNLEFIQNETIAYLSSSWSTASYDEAKCKRDIGFIVSGAIEDVLFGVNSASLVNGKFYWEFPSEANGTGSQIQQTLDGIFYASRLAQNLSQNKVYVTASLEVSASYELLRNNRQFIQSESISFISSSWDGFQYNQTTCMRDITHIIDAVSTDLFYGGNERGVIAGDYYFRFPSTATTTQLDPTVTGIEYAGKLASKLIKNEIFQTASLDDLTIRQLIRDNKTFIQSESLAYLTASWSTFDYDKVKCARDVGYIVDAAATDLLYGGNERSVTAGKYYYQFPSLAIVAGTTNGQLEETIDGIRYAGGVTQKVIQNILFQTASLEVSASFDLLRKNKPFIQAETIAYVSSSWSGVYYNQASCSRDVGFLIDAAATDLLYGGQERSVNAGSFYYLFPSRATNAGVPSEQNQLDPTVTGIKYAGRLSSRVIQNPIYQTPSASVYVATDLLILNRPLIQKETITFLSSSWSTLKYNEISCSRDLGFIIDAVRTDLIYGGNERSIEAGSIYYRIPSVAIFESYNSFGEFGQKQQTVDGINFAKGIAEKIVNNVVLTPPTTRTREAAQRLLGSKEILKKQAIGYTNGAFPYLVYNEASCSRDTGLIVDALVTDLIYGGNERGIEAASSYFNGQYGSAAAVVNDQRTETLETNRYLRTRAEFIAAGAPLESFGSLIVATGIDYSYNGSGVTFKALPPNQGGSGVPNPAFEITELGGGRIFFTSGNQDGDFRIGTGLSINQATGTLVGRTFSKSLFSLVTPFSLALEG
jgi:hypothetical protein